MKLSDRIKKITAGIILTAFIPSQAWAQGITIPPNSTFSLNTGELTVPGNMDNAGHLVVTTGKINLDGNWTNSGVFNAGSSTVNFNAPGVGDTQLLNSGGTSATDDAFYDLTHATAGTVRLVSNALVINDNFLNTAGTFNANSLNIDIVGNWQNTAAFTPGTNTVTLTGGDQWVLGSTTFYDFNKTVGAAKTLTFDAAGTQNFTRSLTMQGTVGQLLGIRSTVNGTQAHIALNLAGIQTIGFVDVKDSNAGVVGVQQTLIGRNSPDHSDFPTYNNTNWQFNNTSITWNGSVSSEWSNPLNWSPGLVPAPGDTVIIPPAAGPILFEPDLCAGGHAFACVDANVGNLSIQMGASLTLSGKNLTVAQVLPAVGVFSNSGTVILQGNETLVLTMDSTHGTFEYVGDGNGASDTRTITICSSAAPLTCSPNVTFNNLIIDDANATPAHRDVFAANGALTVNGDLKVLSGTLNVSNVNSSLAVDGNLTITSPGIFTAPMTNKTFTVMGNFSNTGTFNNSNGTITLNGTNQEVLGTTTFYGFVKSVAAGADTLTFDAAPGTLQTFTNNLTIQGNAANNLLIRSSIPGTQAKILLPVGGTQNILDVDVQDSNAGTVPPPLGDEPLIARGANSHDSGNNVNWLFGAVSFKWNGSMSTEWNNPLNWSPGVVPIAGDSVEIPPIGGSIAFEPDLCHAGHAFACNAVEVGSLTIDAGASLTLSEQNLSVDTSSSGSGVLTNNGTITLNGSETLTATTINTNAGTFDYIGDNTGSTYNILSKLVITNPVSFAYYNLKTNDLNVTPDTFTIGNSPLTINGSLEVDGGILDLSGSAAVSVGANVIINNTGVLKAPAAATNTAFTVGGNWTNAGTLNSGNPANGNTNSNFVSSTGAVTFTTITTAVITGNTSFYDLNSTVPGKTFQFAANSYQTINGVFNVSGSFGNLISLLLDPSAPPNSSWNLFFSAPQSVGELNVFDSNALNNTIDCLNCNPSISAPVNANSRDNVNWIFNTLTISAPAIGTTVGETPTVIGIGPLNSTVYIRDISDQLVATTKVDGNGNFRVVVGNDDAKTGLPKENQLADGANKLTPYISSALIAPGIVNTISVVANPTTDQVPKIDLINGKPITNPVTILTNGYPTFGGKGLANEPVTVQALKGNGDLILVAGSGTTGADGSFSVTLTDSLPSNTNFISVIVGTSNSPDIRTASPLIEVSLAYPFGFVYNTSTNEAVEGAVVTLYDFTTKQKVDGVKSCNSLGDCSVTNPYTTLTDGFYSFLAQKGHYYMTVFRTGYTYPTQETSPNPGRVISPGSKGDDFPVDPLSVAVVQVDQPLDSTAYVLRIQKTANKTEASVGDIVTYTVKIQNLSSFFNANNTVISDTIPPGFKYIKDRVLLNGVPTHEPAGQRPLLFSIGTVPHGASETLQYQLVIGSGVTMGSYKNIAVGQNGLGAQISNPTESLVKIIPNPLFDLGSVIGKVFFDWNENGIQDAPFYDAVSHETIVEKPVPNVQIVMEDGTVITTDKDGKYNIPGLLPGRHLFRLDERTLPSGSYLTTPKAVIVNVTAGSFGKVNFGVNIDQSQTKSRDAVFFNEKIRLTQDRNRPVPRLNAALFNVSVDANPKTEEVLLYNNIVVRPVEFRIFSNYSPFIATWQLNIMDADTSKTIKSFEGNALNINDPIYWNGKDSHELMIMPDHKYSYVLTVSDDHNNRDDTKEKLITVRVIKDEESLKKERDESKDNLKDRAERYRKWLDAQVGLSNLNHQLIQIQGETIHLDRQGTNVKSMRVLKGNSVFTDIPLSEQYGLTPDELMLSGFSSLQQNDNLEIILPNGDYSLDVVSAKDNSSLQDSSLVVPQSVPSSGGAPSPVVSKTQGALEHYSRPLKVGDDYMMFVALGDAQVGYNIDRGHIEPIQDPTLEPGFYKEGKGAYYLKGKILGKYLVTSSYDSDRQQKALFRKLDPNVYYPVYGDQSSINYDAADTQGPLYLLVQWDKSSAILGNYAVDFKDTEFSAFSRSYYGGKIDYQSVSNNPYGDARTKLVVYHAQIQQLPSHNEFLATGGSLYFLKYKNVVQGSDTITLQVRDATTGLVVASQPMVNGVDYELDESQGRILFWQPVSMIAQTQSIISNSLINGNPIYVVVDYQYAVANMQVEGAQGARFAEGVGNNVVLGGTYVEDNSSGQKYNLTGTDATLHVTRDATIKAEYAQTNSQETGSYVSTDGGISFTSLQTNNNSSSGKAFGIKGDARLFDNIGLKAYYKWIGNDFGATSTTYQQGKELKGLSLTFDMTPLTRITASKDIQRLMAGGNLQTSAQVGASETDTTMVQIVHTAERLKLTGQFQLTEVKNVVNGIESTTNQKGATVAGQAQYDLTDRVKLTLGQQLDVLNKNNTATTVGASARVTDQTTLNLQEVISQQGTALTGGVTNQLTPKIALTNAFTLTNLKTGEVNKTVSVGVEDKITDKISTTGNVALTGSSTGTTTTTASIGTKAKISDGMTLDVNVGKSQSSTGAQGATTVNLNGTTQIGNTTVTGTATANGGIGGASGVGIGTTGVNASTSYGVQAITKIDDNLTTNGSVNVATDTTGVKTTTFGFGNTDKLNQELQAVTSNSFSLAPGGSSDSSKYSLVRTVNGKNLQADYTRQLSDQTGNITQSNIFGLSGDVNDKLALNGSVEHGKVQNLDTSRTNRTDFTLGAGYVLKDTETAVVRLKNSLKLELRIDKGTGTDSLRQFVFYDALEGRLTDNLSANVKLDYSKTINTTTGAVAERHNEIILGMAYRPVSFDNLNLIGEYSYQDGYGGGLQQADALNTNVVQTKTQVLSAEGIYDINDKWQASEKIAYRFLNEQVTGFQFTQTHTWLVIHRLNYKIDRNWTISGEYRDLVQVEAKDNKQGLLLEATRNINENTELAIGWNFTKYSDDLTNLSYTSTGPYIRMTGKFYDRTPEEKARDKAKWLDIRISQWAWALIRKELSKKDSKIVLELNRMFVFASVAKKAGHFEESRQIYKDIISAGQMMFDEASEYIRGRIAFEENLQKLNTQAQDYFKGGEYVKARKIWEKVVADASKGVVK